MYCPRALSITPQYETRLSSFSKKRPRSLLSLVSTTLGLKALCLSSTWLSWVVMVERIFVWTLELWHQNSMICWEIWPNPLTSKPLEDGRLIMKSKYYMDFHESNPYGRRWGHFEGLFGDTRVVCKDVDLRVIWSFLGWSPNECSLYWGFLLSSSNGLYAPKHWHGCHFIVHGWEVMGMFGNLRRDEWETMHNWSIVCFSLNLTMRVHTILTNYWFRGCCLERWFAVDSFTIILVIHMHFLCSAQPVSWNSSSISSG